MRTVDADKGIKRIDPRGELCRTRASDAFAVMLSKQMLAVARVRRFGKSAIWRWIP